MDYFELVELYYKLLDDLKKLGLDHLECHRKSKALKQLYFNIMQDAADREKKGLPTERIDNNGQISRNF